MFLKKFPILDLLHTPRHTAQKLLRANQYPNGFLIVFLVGNLLMLAMYLNSIVLPYRFRYGVIYLVGNGLILIDFAARSEVYTWLGRRYGGKGNRAELQAAISWSHAATFIALIPLLASGAYLYFTQTTFLSKTAVIVLAFSFMLAFLADGYRSFLSIQFVAEAHQITPRVSRRVQFLGGGILILCGLILGAVAIFLKYA